MIISVAHEKCQMEHEEHHRRNFVMQRDWAVMEYVEHVSRHSNQRITRLHLNDIIISLDACTSSRAGGGRRRN